MKSRFLNAALAVTTLAFLAACGGGGGGSTPVSAAPAAVVVTTPGGTTGTLSVPVPAVESLASSIVAVSSVGSYTATSEELAAFNLLNTQRLSCGFGSLAQSAQLDAAAKAHADYQIVNNVLSHFEDLTTYPTGFTGVFASDRAASKGYTGAGAVGDEFNVAIGATSKTGLGVVAIRSLLNAPYHLQGLMSGFRDIGIAQRSNTDVGTGSTAVFLQINTGYKTSAGKQLQASADILTYPCEGTTGVNRKLAAEVPNPVPGRDLNTNPLGSSIYIQARDGNVLTITSATMTQISNGLPVNLRTAITSANDPYAPCSEGCYKGNQAYIVADAPMQANSAFQVIINGTNNGAAFSRTFTFTTGSGG